MYVYSELYPRYVVRMGAMEAYSIRAAAAAAERRFFFTSFLSFEKLS